MKNLFSTVECSRLLGIAEHRITYALRAGHLPEPKHLVAGKRICSEAELKRVAKHFGVPVPKEARAKGGTK